MSSFPAEAAYEDFVQARVFTAELEARIEEVTLELEAIENRDQGERGRQSTQFPVTQTSLRLRADLRELRRMIAALDVRFGVS